MKTNTLFILNVLASLFYLGTYNFFPGTINRILLFLIIILFFYTSEKIKQLNGTPYSISRIFIALGCIMLMITIFSQTTNIFPYNLLWLTVVLIIEFYELLVKNKK